MRVKGAALRDPATVNHTLGDYLGEAFRFKIAPCAVLVPPALNQSEISKPKKNIFGMLIFSIVVVVMVVVGGRFSNVLG
jgi:hypothetical protein